MRLCEPWLRQKHGYAYGITKSTWRNCVKFLMPYKLWKLFVPEDENYVQTTERSDYIDLEWLQLKEINCPLSPFPSLSLTLSFCFSWFFRHIFSPVRLYRLFWSRLTDSTISREVPRHYEHNFQQSFTSRTRGNYLSGELELKIIKFELFVFWYWFVTIY